MAPITATIEVARPPQDSFDYVTDPSRLVEWQQGVVEGHMDSNGERAVGDRCVTTRRIGFAQRPGTAELTQLDIPRTWAVRGIDGPIRATVNVTVTPLDDGRRSLLRIDLDFTGHGIGRLLVPMVRPGARKEMPANLQRLKERLERN